MLIETIRIQEGIVQHLHWHQARLDRSRSLLFDSCAPIDLARRLRPPTGRGTLKCRVLYGAEGIYEITYTPYRPRPVRSLKIVEASLDYAHKYSDRQALEELFARRKSADDILIVREGLVTDTSIANVAFLKDGRWYTPRTPLLAGTTRQRLIQNGFLTPRDIPVSEVDRFEGMALMNAMIGFCPVKNGKIL